MSRKRRRESRMSSNARKTQMTQISTKDLHFLENCLANNQAAMNEGPRKKRWTAHDLKTIRPLTPAQEDFFHSCYNEDYICAHGFPGTGKTLLALYHGLNAILDQDPRSPQKQIILIRSILPTRDMGFMPGNLEEKMSYYENPYRDICEFLLGRSSSYDDLKAAGLIKFMSTSYIRGITWEDSVVIIDEGQNCTFHEINSAMTRIGNNSKLMFLCDQTQSDFQRSSDKQGLLKFLEIAKRMPEFAYVNFTQHDIVRSSFVKSWIMACDNALN